MDSAGTCPHCSQGVQFVVHDSDSKHMPRQAVGGKIAPNSSTGALAELGYSIETKHCPLCKNPIVYLRGKPYIAERGRIMAEETMIYPTQPTREPPKEVENAEIRKDYTEAWATRASSLRGAAALARRSLQNALRDRGFRDDSNKLHKEIKAALDSGKLSSELAERLHYLREVGNDGAHPNYDHAGEIVDVEPDEFDLLMEILDEFFDVLYVKPARFKAAKAAREAKKKVPPPEK